MGKRTASRSSGALVFLACFLLVLISTVDLDTYFPYFAFLKSAMNFVVIIAFIYCIYRFKDIYIDTFIVSGILLLLVGLIGTVLWGKQSFSAVLQDIFYVGRFFVVYVFSRIYFKNKEKYFDSLFFMTKPIVIIMFLLSVHDILFTPFFPSGDERNFIRTQCLFFSHPTFLTHIAVLFLFICFLDSAKNGRRNLQLELFCSFLIIVAGRTKGISFLIVFWLLYIVFIRLKLRNKFIITCIGIVSVFLISWGTFSSYFFDDTYSPRKIMYHDSCGLMLSKFPIGYGFASYGSPAASTNYSPLYQFLNYQMNYGMSSSKQSFYLTDTFWHMLFGQYGVLGTFLFCIVFFLLIKKALKNLKSNIYIGFIELMIITYLLITSTAETAFFNTPSLLLFFVFMMFDTFNIKKETL